MNVLLLCVSLSVQHKRGRKFGKEREKSRLQNFKDNLVHEMQRGKISFRAIKQIITES